SVGVSTRSASHRSRLVSDGTSAQPADTAPPQQREVAGSVVVVVVDEPPHPQTTGGSTGCSLRVHAPVRMTMTPFFRPQKTAPWADSPAAATISASARPTTEHGLSDRIGPSIARRGAVPRSLPPRRAGGQGCREPSPLTRESKPP